MRRRALSNNGRLLRLGLALALLGAAPAQAALLPRVPLAQEHSARPKLGLRLAPWKLRTSGTAESKVTRPVRRASPRTILAAEAKAERELATAEALARQVLAPAVRNVERQQLLKQAAEHYASWDDAVRVLVKAGKFDRPAYKTWAKKTWEARLVELHAAARAQHPFVEPAKALGGSIRASDATWWLGGLRKRSWLTFKKTLEQAADGLYGGAGAKKGADVIRENPLVVTRVAWNKGIETPSALSSMVTYKPSLLSPNRWFGRNSYRVRRDIAFVWVPGVARTYTEFTKQQRTILENGVLSLRAETGSFRNSYRNAYDIAAAVNRARKITGNPNVRVVLVGYSQGNNDIFAFMQAEGRNPKEKAMFSELRKNIVHIHDLHSAARGTPIADVGIVFTKILTGRAGEIDNLPERLLELEQLLVIDGSRVKLGLVRFLGKHLDRANDILKWLNGRNATRFRFVSWMSDRVHDFFIGAIEPLTTERGHELMSAKALQENVRAIPITNTVGVVPKGREKELIPNRTPLNQVPGWKFLMEAFNLPNDYQVPEERQKLEPVLDGAVDLRSQAMGHWGIVGVPVGIPGWRIHDERQYPKFSTELHTLALLDSVQRLGLADRQLGRFGR